MKVPPLAWVLGVIGSGAVALAFYMQAQVNHRAAVDQLLGYRPEGSPGPWVVGIGGVVCILIAVVLAFRPTDSGGHGSALTPGWYDDPESPVRLRYHDGAGWTERTADKTSS